MVQNDYLPKPDTLFRACKNIKTPKDILKASEDFKTNAKQFENDIKELKFLAMIFYKCSWHYGRAPIN